MLKKLLNATSTLTRTLIASVVVALAFVSCNDDKDFSRANRLTIKLDTVELNTATPVICPVTGVDTVLYVSSNVDYTMTFRTSDDDTEWLTITDGGYDAEADAKKYIIHCKPSTDGTFLKRTGTLSIVYPDDYLGEFIQFVQGFSTRLGEKFNFLNTGSDIPFNTLGEKLLSDWTTAQKEVGWTSPTIGDNTSSYLYSKKGYVKLGDGEHAAQLLTPDLAKMVADSVVVFSFQAVAYTDEQGNKDNNTLTVSIEEGGMFADGSKSKTLALPYYNPTDANVATNMWNNSTFNLAIVTTATNVFTDKTAMRFSVGEGKNRVFIDNVYIYIIDESSLYILDYLKNK